MTLQEAKILALRVLKQVMEEKLDHHNVQIAQVRLTVLDYCTASPDCIPGDDRERVPHFGRG